MLYSGILRALILAGKRFYISRRLYKSANDKLEYVCSIEVMR